ncbi:hypothetical protein F5890DRAFT_1471606 [Lentinula detonsa]|uniref:Protein-S-isoprenylcysteine O-methyltransferase n=1 Tax=Lentinula detonsa TaxID=2804962 RepID=A0AA38UWQ7_9AGAR|nr:hypothetical protein F5890DRAFT_1471606 [Lentinula detonsa]
MYIDSTKALGRSEMFSGMESFNDHLQLMKKTTAIIEDVIEKGVPMMHRLHITATPPHPPPAKNELAPSTKWEFVVKYRGGPVMIKALGYQTLAKSVIDPVGTQMRVGQPSKSGLPSVDLHPSPMFLLGTSLATTGGYIRCCCYRELGRMFTFEMTIMKDHKLVTSGPYAWARHPAYAGVLCTISGIVMLHCAPGSWLIECKVLESALGKGMAIIYLTLTSMITIGLMKRMTKEDEALAERFGQEWKDWSQRVPFKLFWGIY